jgi:dienelactone hydrolase
MWRGRVKVAVRVVSVALVGVGVVPVAAVASPPTVFNPVVEAQNFAKTQERQTIYDTPDYQARLVAEGTKEGTAALLAQASDSGRFFTNNLCWNHENGCAGDIRLYDWANNGYGLVRPVLFTARNGAILSGHVWSTVAGPAKRPGVVITNGSVQADEQMYWFAAQALAKAGYVVLTFDPQGQGQSDTPGKGPDALEGVPAQTDGRPFFDGTEDALNFFFSDAAHPYEPVKSCSTGTSHADEQDSRVKAGLNAAFNPYAGLLDRDAVGIAGHSYGAAGVSYIAQSDPRVKAVVAWDNLAGADPANADGPTEQGCPADPAARAAAPITKPGLGMSADYFLPPTPNTSLPDPQAKSKASLLYSKAGVDTGEVIIRGGSHLDFSFIPNQAFGASLRGPDMIDWYTTAWFDKYLKHDATADGRLLTQRWRTDPVEGALDTGKDANVFSFYYRSRLQIHLADGTPYDCENLRDGCPGLVSDDGYQGNYAYIDIDRTADAATGAGASLAGQSGLGACSSQAAITFRLHKVKGRRIVRVKLYVDGKRVLTKQARPGKALRRIRLPGIPGTKKHKIRIDDYTRRGLARRTTRTVRGCGKRTKPVTSHPKHKR